MIDFLNFKKDFDKCVCGLKTAYTIQLLPFQYVPYYFYTGSLTDEIDLIHILDSYGNEINLDFNTVSNYLLLKNIPFDDPNNVVLRITTANGFLYSDEFKISSKNACKTTRLTFGCDKNEVMQSVSFPFWFKQNSRNLDLERAYDIATKSSVSYSTANAKYKIYQTEFMSTDILCKINDAMISTYVYFDFERVSLFEPIEIDEQESDANFIETKIMVNEYKGLENESIKPLIFIQTEDNNPIITENENIIIVE